MWYRNDSDVPKIAQFGALKVTLNPFDSIEVDDKFAGRKGLTDITFEREGRHAVKPQKNIRKIIDANNMEFLRGSAMKRTI